MILWTLYYSLRKPDLSKNNTPKANARILRAGVKIWNKAAEAERAVNEHYKPNLRGANLRKADLRNADLRRANLSEADLRGAKLYNADMRYAFFLQG